MSSGRIVVELSKGGGYPFFAADYEEVTFDLRDDIPVSTRRGRQQELQRFASGEAHMGLNSLDGKYDQLNTSGPWYNKLVPQTPFRVLGEHPWYPDQKIEDFDNPTGTSWVSAGANPSSASASSDTYLPHGKGLSMTGGGTGDIDFEHQTFYPATPGQSWVASARMKRDSFGTAKTVRVLFYWYNSSHALISVSAGTGAIEQFSSVFVPVWVRTAGISTGPSGTAYVRMGVRIVAGDSTSHLMSAPVLASDSDFFDVLPIIQCYADDFIPVQQGRDMITSLDGHDAFSIFALQKIQSRLYVNAVLADGATDYWRLGEPEGYTSFLNRISGRTSGNMAGVVIPGKEGALIADVDTAVDLGRRDTPAVGGTEPGGHISLGTAPGISGSNKTFTLEAWIMPPPQETSLQARDIVLKVVTQQNSSGNHGAGSFEFLWFSPAAASADSTLSMTIEGSGSSLSSHVLIVDPLNIPTSPVLELRPGQWNHVVAVCEPDGGGSMRLRIHVNGQADSSISDNTIGGAVTTSVGGVGIGGDSSFAYDNQSDGLIDEVAIYNGVALTPAQILHHYQLGRGGFQFGNTTGGRISEVLDQGHWPTGLSRRLVATGDHNAGGSTSKLTDKNLLTYMQDVEIVEDGALYMGSAGQVVFLSHSALPTGSSFTFGNGGGGEIPCELRVVPDNKQIWTEVRASRLDGEARVSPDPALGLSAQQQKYGVRTLDYTGKPFESDSTAQDAANALEARFHEQVTRVEYVVVNPGTDSNLWKAIFQIDLLDAVAVHHRPVWLTSGFITFLCRVQGIEHNHQRGVHRVRYDLALQ